MKKILPLMVLILLVICLVRLFTRSIDHYSRSKLGFIIIRHIQDKRTSSYWFKSYKSIRKHYPNIPIVIVDDNSNPEFINSHEEDSLHNCRIIQSEYPKRGEMLAYYYFLQHHWFERAVILHDSVFVRQKVDFDKCKNVKFLWHFHSNDSYDDVYFEKKFLDQMNGPYMDRYTEKAWRGCFGVMAVIDHAFLKKIAYLFVLRDSIHSRRHRSCIERIFAVICFHHYPELIHDCSVFGDIQHQYPRRWGYTLEEYEKDQEKNNIHDLPPFVKVWTGR